MANGAQGSFLAVQDHRLLYRGAPIRLKGFNLELFGRNPDTIWRDYWSYRSDLIGLLDRARTFDANTIRLIFPQHSLRLNSDGSVPGDELDKLDDFLAAMADRGMGAIVTVFNRHNYPIANQGFDGRKVASFVNRFGQDPRVLMWDIANEPPIVDDAALNIATLMWLRAMRAAFDAGHPAQPITIGANFHFALTWIDEWNPVPQRSMIELSDVISIHCYGRYQACGPGVAQCTPPTDASNAAVRYQADGFNGASFEYIRLRTSKPILLGEFGWPDRESDAWPPGHPWGIYNYPETADTMDQLYRDVLAAVDRFDIAGAIQWTLQDADATRHFFGLWKSNGDPKRAGVAFSAYEQFRSWNRNNVQQFDYTRVTQPLGFVDVPGDAAVVGGSILAQGWAVDLGHSSATGVDRVAVYLDGDGAPRGLATYGTPRPDVALAMGRGWIASCGWQLNLDLSGVPAGEHTLHIKAHSTVSDQEMTYSRRFVRG